jgi:serine/threonine protein kinase
MELVAGRMLSDVVEAEHPLSPQRVARIVEGVARGLAHAEQQRIVNRDIKPDNILLATADDTAKILDYGLALIAELDGESFRVTRTGATLGTPGFLSPEQAADPHGVTCAADVYSLACTAFYCLTRQPPFTGANLEEFHRKHALDPRPGLCVLRPDVPIEFERLVHRMMAIEPAHRPSAREVATELARLLPAISDARPPLHAPSSQVIDVSCPECGEVYHVRADAFGKRLQCRNKLCHHRFTVELPGAGGEWRVAGGGRSPGIVDALPVDPLLARHPPPALSTRSRRATRHPLQLNRLKPCPTRWTTRPR